MKILFIRHAESEKNIGEKFDKETDQKDQLTSKGQEEIIIMSAYLSNIISNSKSSVLITGSRRRTIESTKNISKILSFDYQVMNELVPINPGALSGLSYDEAFRAFPELMEKRKLFVQNIISGYDLIFPEGDLFKDYEKNVKKCVDNIIEKYTQFENIFIITHRSVILATINIYNKLLGVQDKSIYKYYSTPDGCIVEVEFSSTIPENLTFHGGIDDWSKNILIQGKD
jgi:broad specificity phosphatase PhoE